MSSTEIWGRESDDHHMEELQVKALLKRLVKRNDGFTLTELAVAMVVVGILASIAVPSFLGARNNAFDREAQAAVDAALNAASMHYANNGDFTNSANSNCNNAASETLAADLQRLEPNFDMVSGSASSALPRQVSVQAALTYNADGENLGCQAIYATVLSRSGSCWVGRVTIEGRFLEVDTATPPQGVAAARIIVNTGSNNTANSATTRTQDLQVNGKAYGGLIALTPAADGADVANANLGEIQADCNADSQATLAAGLTSTGVDPVQFYDAWRTVVVVTNGGA